MEKARPWFRRALYVAIVAYVAGTALLISDLYEKVGVLEHDAMHAQEGIEAHGPAVP